MSPIEKKENINIFYLLLLSILLLTFDGLSGFHSVRNTLEKFFQPITFYGLEISNQIGRKVDSLSSFSNSSATISGLKTKLNQLEVKSADYDLLKQKYESLLSHSQVAQKKYKYIQASVYVPEDGSDLLIDLGKNNGVESGDIVVVGNSYLGRVSRTDNLSSSVMSADQPGSTLEVVILKKGNKEVRAIAKGINHEILIQNILSSSGVANGDIVLISDKSINGTLVLGKISDLIEDKAASIISAKVTSDIDLSVNKFVYVRK